MRYLPLILLIGLSLSVAPVTHAQNQKPFDLTLHGNNGSTPMVGVGYQVTDRMSVRAAAGYFQQNVDGEGVDQMTTRGPAGFEPYTIHQFSGSVAAPYDLYRSGIFSIYTGPEVQYLYARADRTVTFNNSKSNDRFSLSELVGVKLEITDWLKVFGEAGFGYVNGMRTNSTSSFSWKRTSRWGFTHAGPGLEVQF